jgi:pimeloyl-ACP methyl ester carboxylesterase
MACLGRRPTPHFTAGGFGSWLHWIRNIPALASRFTVLAANLPGFGDSDDLPEPHTPDHIAAIVSAGIDRLLAPEERFHSIGFSFGGFIGGIVAALQGDRLISHTFSGTIGGMGQIRNPLEPLHNWRLAKTMDEARLQAHRRNLEIMSLPIPEYRTTWPFTFKTGTRRDAGCELINTETLIFCGIGCNKVRRSTVGL